MANSYEVIYKHVPLYLYKHPLNIYTYVSFVESEGVTSDELFIIIIISVLLLGCYKTGRLLSAWTRVPIWQNAQIECVTR